MSNSCTPFPMPTMSGLHVGQRIGVISPAPAISCPPKINPQPTPLPGPTPASISAISPPALTQTRRAPNVNRTVAKLERPPLDWRVSGPFPQTLFLGCSVVDFSLNLGWGSGEGSTLTVTLIRDPMPTFSVSAESIADKSSRYMGMNYAALKAAAEGVRDTADHYYNVMKPPKSLVESLQNALAALPVDYTEAQYREVMERHRWTAPAAFTDVNGGPIIPGKLYYEFDTQTKRYVQKYWLGPDPGFIADKDNNNFLYQSIKNWSINIIGAPARFVVDEFIFCGIITDWKKSVGSGGLQYTVTLQTPVNLLRNAKLILGHYAGSVFTKNTSVPVVRPSSRTEYDGTIPLTAWENIYKQQYPSAFVSFARTYKGYVSGPVNITDTYVSNPGSYTNFVNQSWRGDIKNDGNLPNVINIYGYLESLGPGFFGGSRQNELGIKYNIISGTLGAMLGSPSPNTNSPFNPFGALVGVSAEPPYLRPDNTTPHNWIEVFNLNDKPTVQDGLSVPNASVALGNVAGADSPALKTASAVYSNTTYGGLKSIFDFGIIAPSLSVASNTYKQLYYLDLTELPVMPDLLRYDSINSPTISIAEFIDDVCSKGGCEYFWEMLNIRGETFGILNQAETYNILKLRTVSRKTQPPETAIEEYLRGFIGAKTQIDYGKEFNNDAKTRVMYVGGKQKRLIQVKNFRLGKSQSVHIYSPITRRFMILDVKEKNKIRIPNVGSTRHPLNLIRGAENTNLNEISTFFFANDLNWNQTDYGGGGGAGGTNVTANTKQTEADDENPAVSKPQPSRGNLKLKSARERGNKSQVIESPITFLGNYLPSATLVFNRYRDIVVYKTRMRANENSPPAKKTLAYTVQKFVDNTYNKVSSFVISGAQLSLNAVTKWFGMKTITLSWKNTSSTPSYTNVYGDEDHQNIGVNSPKNKANVRSKITTINRFFPLMHDVICPYFGSYKYLPIDGVANSANSAEYIKTPRPVWYDMWTNQIVVVFTINDLPRTRMNLRGTYANGTSFVITESEIRAALAGFDSWIGYLSARLFKPDIVHMIKNFLCPPVGVVTTPPGDPGTQRGTTSGDPDRKNDPVPANQPTEVSNDGGAGSSVPSSSAIYDLDNLNECDYCDIFRAIFKIPKINIMNGSVLHANNPINLKAGLAGAFYDDMNILWSFFKNIGENFYGKQFMVKLPMIRTYIDRSVYIVDDGYANSLSYNSTMSIMEGDGRIYSNYKISPQGAWEEAGNMIDDQIVIGGWYSNIFQNEKGLIGPILGFWSSMGFDYESYFICKLLKEQNAAKLDPEKTKGAAFKMGDMIHTPRVCLENIAGTRNNATTDNSSQGAVPDPRTKPFQQGSDDLSPPPEPAEQ
jgi:hypothetical protein